MKIGDENGNIVLNIVYGSNHFEPIELFNNASNNMDISTNDVDNDTQKNCIHVLWIEMMNKIDILQSKKDFLGHSI
jgi:hypothetical protein